MLSGLRPPVYLTIHQKRRADTICCSKHTTDLSQAGLSHKSPSVRWQRRRWSTRALVSEHSGKTSTPSQPSTTSYAASMELLNPRCVSRSHGRYLTRESVSEHSDCIMMR